MEYLSDWEPGDQSRGCTLQRARAVMESLADLHASFWHRVDDGNLDWVPDSYPSLMSRGVMAGTKANYDNFSHVFRSVLTPELAGAKDRFIEGLPRLRAWVNAEPRTVLHGYLRLDNIFFKGPDEEVEVACCDWQSALRGKGIHDVAYFLSGNIDSELRRAHEKELIGDWVQALQKRGITDYRFEQAFDDYRKAILMLWTYVVNNAGLAVENQRTENWITAQVTRHTAAMVDHDCLSLL